MADLSKVGGGEIWVRGGICPRQNFAEGSIHDLS